MPKRSTATAIFLDLFQCSPGAPDLGLLGDVGARFSNLPWENLTKYVRKHRLAAPPADDAPAHLRGISGAGKLRSSRDVLEGYARSGTGGTCFSLTNALRRIVTDLGYAARPAMADMRHRRNIHCALVVVVGGRRWLLDPGFLLSEPVPLAAGRAARVRLAGSDLEYRPVPGLDEYDLFTVRDDGEEVFRYRLRPGPVAEEEFARHWLDSFDASGMHGLHLNRVTSEGRLSAHDLNLRIDDGASKRNVKLRDDYVNRISERFGIDREVVGEAFDAWQHRRWRNG